MAEAMVVGGGGHKYIDLSLTIEEAAWIRLLVGQIGGMDRYGVRQINDAIYLALSGVVSPTTDYIDWIKRGLVLKAIFGEDKGLAINAAYNGAGWEPYLLGEDDG